MLEAFRKSGVKSTSINLCVFECAWRVAYAAGMERAAEICDDLPCEWMMREECADAIRAEIKEKT